MSWSAYQSLTPESLTPSRTDGSAPAGPPASGPMARADANQPAAAPGDRDSRCRDIGAGGSSAWRLERAGTRRRGSDRAQNRAASRGRWGTGGPCRRRHERRQIGDSAGQPEAPSPRSSPRRRQVPTGSVGVVEKADGVLLRFSNDKREWERIAEGTPLGTSDVLLCLAPFRSRIIIGKTPITLLGETLVRLTAKNATDDPAFELQTGRARIEIPTAPARLKIDFAGRTVDIQRASPGVLAVERQSQWRYAQPASQPPALTIHAADGEQTLTLDQAKETLIAPGTVVADVGGKLSTRTEKTVPKWLTETEVTLKDQKIGEQFLKQFSAGRPVLADIVAATEDDSPVTKKLAIYAVKALGDLSLLTPILSRANDPSARQSTIVALRESSGARSAGPAQAQGTA